MSSLSTRHGYRTTSVVLSERLTAESDRETWAGAQRSRPAGVRTPRASNSWAIDPWTGRHVDRPTDSRLAKSIASVARVPL